MLANNSEFVCPGSGTHRRNWILVDDSSGTAKEDLCYDLIDNSYAFVVMSQFQFIDVGLYCKPLS